MAKRKSVAWALVAAVGACAESSNEPVTTPDTSLDSTASLVAVNALLCAGSQGVLPVSQACDTGQPSLFADVNPDARLAFAKCVWKTFEAQLTPTEALRFRLQDCSAAPEMPLIDVASKGRALSVRLGTDRSAREPFLRTYELDGVDGAAFLEKRRAALTPEERDRCIIRPYQTTDFTGRKGWDNLYEIAPNPEYLAEIEARGEPAAACGAEGWSNDGVRFWELRDGEAWFWDIGQEAPLYDPRSFTTLHRHGEGAWGLEDMKTVGLAN
ncbi:MAG: hypothetical protein ABWZ40_03690 [Caulobacterales bacterium]